MTIAAVSGFTFYVTSQKHKIPWAQQFKRRYLVHSARVQPKTVGFVQTVSFVWTVGFVQPNSPQPSLVSLSRSLRPVPLLLRPTWRQLGLLQPSPFPLLLSPTILILQIRLLILPTRLLLLRLQQTTSLVLRLLRIFVPRVSSMIMSHTLLIVQNLPPIISPTSSDSLGTSHPLEHYLNYSNIDAIQLSFLAAIDSDMEPRTYSEAAKDLRWRLAMADEIRALEDNDTWAVQSLPPGKKPIGCKWVFKIKRWADGTIERYKARLVAKGFTQIEGVDFHETFASIAKLVTCFRIKDLGPLSYFLGIEIIRSDSSLFLNQRKTLAGATGTLSSEYFDISSNLRGKGFFFGQPLYL
ncbi:hypothetical protein CRG98_041875 [Punica granatum]|uniref:Reverse transcriptase Ty1/copia-type domain-containing protein n=1 Tax=Punica granatum TaxID=22663 RepID=A0A2I0I174_PUNGR|nr:hypothetical protein CRG98_041875 [Punica granatum]